MLCKGTLRSSSRDEPNQPGDTMASDSTTGGACKRTMIATFRKNKAETVVLHDELPALQQGEIRMRVDKVGLSANNNFYAQMGEAPFLKFFAVYPVAHRPDLANVPAWGTATIVESNHPDFAVGEQYRGFLHMSNVVQMKAKRTAEGFVASGGNRDKLNKAYNGFIRVKDSKASPFAGSGPRADLATIAAPGALSGLLLCELLRMNRFYGANSIVLTSASSKLSLATAFLLKAEREQGTITRIIGYSAAKNAPFVRATGLFDDVLTYEEDLPTDPTLKPVFIDVAGDATVYRRIQKRLAKALAVGGTHSKAKASTFTAFSPGGIVKMVGSMVAPPSVATWLDRHLDPTLEMFFAPTVMTQLVARWGRATLDERCDAALAQFVDAALEHGWIKIVRAEATSAIQAEYRRIVEGTVPPSEAIIVSLDEHTKPATNEASATVA